MYIYFKEFIMGASELKSTKKELVDWIESLKDDTIISFLISVKLSNEGMSGDWWDELTKNDQANILNGIRDHEQGNTMSSKDFWNNMANG